MTQEVLGGLANVTQNNLSRIESGKAEPGLITLGAIAHALGVKLSDLLDGVD
jgi:transcriptional regulator with XRE-family HTH domain